MVAMNCQKWNAQCALKLTIVIAFHLMLVRLKMDDGLVVGTIANVVCEVPPLVVACS